MNEQKIESLKKTTLSIEAGTTPDTMDLTSEPLPFEFIFGVGKEGLTPFECELADKTEGDVVSFQVDPGKRCETFEHIAIPFPDVPGHLTSFYLKTQVVSVTPAGSREVVKAMAQVASCGDGCCGDGCCSC